jgi:hypothetical protein
MNRPAILIAALLVFALAVGNIVLGANLITPLAIAETRGAGTPWYIVWGMVLLTVGCAVFLGGYLIAATARKK